jgi:hypothetical protein
MFYVKVSAHIQKVSAEFLPKRTAIHCATEWHTMRHSSSGSNNGQKMTI